MTIIMNPERSRGLEQLLLANKRFIDKLGNPVEIVAVEGSSSISYVDTQDLGVKLQENKPERANAYWSTRRVRASTNPEGYPQFSGASAFFTTQVVYFSILK